MAPPTPLAPKLRHPNTYPQTKAFKLHLHNTAPLALKVDLAVLHLNTVLLVPKALMLLHRNTAPLTLREDLAVLKVDSTLDLRALAPHLLNMVPLMLKAVLAPHRLSMVLLVPRVVLVPHLLSTVLLVPRVVLVPRRLSMAPLTASAVNLLSNTAPLDSVVLEVS